MRAKLTLKLEALQVESFEAAAPGAGAGTVRAHVTTPDPISLPPTDQASCHGGGCSQVGSCANTCTCPGGSAGLTHCIDTCPWCASVPSDYPAIC